MGSNIFTSLVIAAGLIALSGIVFISADTAQAQGTTITTCPAGTGVDATTNPDLAADCVVLLNARDLLIGTDAGAGTLNWSGDLAMSRWEGIWIGGSPRRVRELVLGVKGLTGVIPESLGQLDKLQRVALNWNSLGGSIPAKLGDLTDLRQLLLYNNQLSGEIPKELGKLSQLTRLNMSNNRLTGKIPAELGDLAKLRSLVLTHNQLSGEIPKELGKLSQLTELNMSNNRLTGKIPAELGGLAKLSSLILTHNRLTGSIPAELGGLAKLRSLVITHNRLTGSIPAELGNLAQLEALFLNHNQLTGCIPGELNGLAELTALSLHNNRLNCDIPPELGDLKKLTRLELYSNNLSGNIPPKLGDLGNLRELLLSGNQLTGPIPPELGKLSDLTRLWLQNNELSGEISRQLGDLNKLEELLLRNNDFDGTIPPEIGEIPTLRSLWVDNNDFEGCIPLTLREANPSTFGGIRDLPTAFGLPWCDAMTTAPTPTSTALISRIVPEVRSVTLLQGDVVLIAVDVYGVQNILDNSLANDLTFKWDLVNSGGDSHSGAIRDPQSNPDPIRRVIALTMPNDSGRYTLTASLDPHECRDLTPDEVNDCTATVSINVRRRAAAPEPTAPPADPPGEIPTALVDEEGNEYVVFSPTKGGKFESDDVSVFAKPGAIPDGDVIGVRSVKDGAADCEHKPENRAMLSGSRYRIDAVDVDGQSLKSYRLKAPVEVCLSLPAAMTENLGHATLAVVDDFCDLTLASSRVSLGHSGLKVCGAVGQLPVTVAAATTEIPIPTAMPITDSEAEELPDTGGYELPSKALLLILIFGIAVTLAGMASASSRRNARIYHRLK